MFAARSDSFGDFGRCRSRLQWAASAVDRVVTAAITIALVALLGLSGYAVWDSLVVSSGADSIKNAGLTFAELRAINPDVVAWITVGNTHIDYPVCKGEDDFEYLSRDATGKPSTSGSLFLDAACDTSFAEPYEVIMGHHMEGGKMLGDLDKFADESFFWQNRTATLKLPDRTLMLESCAYLVADAYDNAMYGLPATAASAVATIERTRQLATFADEDALDSGAQLIALSTCSSDGANARTMVVYRVVGEEEAQNA